MSQSPTASTSGQQQHPYKKRPYAKACLACKARKIRCRDIEDPPCKNCRTARIPCELPSRPVRQRRVQVPKAEDGAGALALVPSGSGSREVGQSSQHPTVTVSASAFASMQRRLARLEATLHLPPLSPDSPEILLHGRRLLGSTDRRASRGDHDGDDDMKTDASDGASDAGGAHGDMDPPRFALGGEEQNVYHGETSMYDEPPQSYTDPSPQTNPSTGSHLPRIDASNWTEHDIRSLTRLRHKYATPEEGEALVDAYFCWASPTYAVVNRTLFLRDMAINGPYFSDLLLLAVYLSGLRFSPNLDAQARADMSKQYMGIFYAMFVDELAKPTTIVTAQALLTLAGRMVAVGEMTQAWLFTGLGIRMIQDLGIHLAIEEPSLDSHIEPEIRDIRVRLYWSAYCWDKTLSLGMGREPALTCRPERIPDVILNDAEDDWEWKPYFPTGGNLDLVLRYPPTTSMTNFVLRFSSKLNIILDSILVNMYSPHRPEARSTTFIRRCDERLRAWRHELPAVIKLDSTNLPEFCPPTNITVLNLLYHVTRILLYRPLLRNQPAGVTTSSLEVCRASAMDIHEILSLWGRTFGNVNMVYLIMYCTFVAAGVDVILLRIGDATMRDEALKRIHLSLAILERASAQGPGIRRGISIIASQLQAAMPHAPSSMDRFTESSLRHAPMGANPALGLSTGPQRQGGAMGEPFDSFAASCAPGRVVPPSFSPNDSNAGSAGPSGPASGGVPGSTTGPEEVFSSASGLLSNRGRGGAISLGGIVGAPNPLFADPLSQQALADLLGEAAVGTDDPFAFLSGEGWDEVMLQ